MAKRTAFSAEHCAVVLRALGDVDRLRIVQLLRKRPYSVSKLAEKLELEVANVSHHLGVLRRVSLVKASRKGRQVIYELAESVAHDESDSLQFLDLGCCRLEIAR